MKQNITEEQLNELSVIEKGRLAEYCLNKGWAKKVENDDNSGYINIPPLSIGQMVEFLDSESGWNLQIESRFDTWVLGDDEGYDMGYDKEYESIELCDALWDAVKEVLNKEVRIRVS